MNTTDMQQQQQQDMDLLLSSDSKPRLKWTPILHQRFIEAVSHLGGPERATPKGLMRVMGIPGLTLFHLKSHLQKYRLGKNQQSETCHGNEQQVSEVEGAMDGTCTQIQALEMQMEVQNKLHEQIEVQRHLQLRIEAQGMYLQSILKKAQDTLSGYNSELHLSCSFSADSCLTCSETKVSSNVVGSCYRFAGRKRSGSTISDESCVEQPELKIAPPQQEKPLKVRREIDLNCSEPDVFDECLEAEYGA